MPCSLSIRKGNTRARLALALVVGLAAPRAPDLDVAIPPGSPLDWGGSFPGYTPPDQPLFPVTRASEPDPQRTSAVGGRGAAAESEVRFAQSFGLLRILTWDLSAHLPWITKPPRGPISGGGNGRPAPPRYGDPLYWVGLAPLLRLMLHPEVSSASETLAHLVELGDPLLPVLSASAAEPSLEPYLVRLRELVTSGGGVPAGPLEGAPRARLFARFTLEECLRDEPYDPSGEFGKRMFLFHEEVEPWLASFARHPSLALRRNAVAALARYRTRASASALASVAASERDPVTLLRALAALAGFRGKLDEAPLVARGLAEPDPVLRAAWIGALGRMGARSAVSGLVELGEGALARGDSELLLSLLGALAQIPPTAEHARVALFARRVQAEVHGEPSRWRAKGPRGAEVADVPDPGDARAQWLEELALLVQVAAEPLDADLHRRLLALGRPAAADPRISSGAGTIDPLAGLAPGARLLYLHVLAQIGELGQERLAALALDAGLESAQRGRALALTSYDRRSVLGLRLAADPRQPPEVRIQALEVLRVDRHDGLDGPCQKLFDELLAAPALTAPATQRYLWTFALRQRTARGPLSREALFALWRSVRASPVLQRSLRQQVASRLEALLQAVREGARGKKLEDEARAFLELARPFGPPREAREERAALEALLEELAELRKHANEEGFDDALRAAILLRLTGVAPPTVASNGFFEPSVPLEEEIVLALGRARDVAATELLLQLLRTPDSDLAGWSCLALGLSGERAAASELVPFLSAREPFVRLCAGEALQKLTGREFDYDWVYDPEPERVLRARELAQSLAR